MYTSFKTRDTTTTAYTLNERFSRKSIIARSTIIGEIGKIGKFYIFIQTDSILIDSLSVNEFTLKSR